MKKFLITGILFFMIFFIVEKSANYFLYTAPQKEQDKRLEQLLNGNINKDLVVIGSSIGASDILTKQIQMQTGYSSFNLSYPGSNILFQEFILKTLLKFNEKPKMVIMAIDNPSEFIDTETLTFRLDKLYPLSKYNYINEALIKHNEKNSLSKIFCLARLNKSNIKFKSVEKSSFNPIDNFGSMPFIKRKSNFEIPFSDSIQTYNPQNESVEKLKSFYKIQDICKRYNIQLIFVFCPYYGSFNSSFKNRFQQLSKSENSVFVYDTLNPIYKNEDYYYDVSHLMKNGAEVFTSEISSFINKNLINTP